jgi:hypothetical protein
MNNITKGPWATDHGTHDAPLQNIKILGAYSHPICELWIDDAPVPDFNREQEANAKLICAAPKLLEACKKARTCNLPDYIDDLLRDAVASTL